MLGLFRRTTPPSPRSSEATSAARSARASSLTSDGYPSVKTTSPVAPSTSGMFITVLRIFALRLVLVSSSSVRRIPENSANSGSTFLASPAWNDPMESTAGSVGSTVLPTSCIRASTVLHAIATTSSPLCGSAPCAPLPRIAQSNMSDAARTMPLCTPTLPAGRVGSQCSANAALASSPSSSPSSIMGSAPPDVSSAG
ncbi:MAG: hypothetical protein BWY99_02772 [Synergistetes bacterium ADurb.BinA166]|nr:MAG: hypothetical protein BWY99_02772 [Synergistetes bacterium ADurb.BinA166]